MTTFLLYASAGTLAVLFATWHRWSFFLQVAGTLAGVLGVIVGFIYGGG